MTKSTLAPVAALAVLVGLSTTASADTDGRGHWRHGMGPRFFAMQMMERYDANKDGKISQEEIDTNRTEWLQRFDTEKDGGLSLKEFEALWLEAHRGRMVREFQFFDRDGDGKVTLEEYKRPLTDLVRNHDRNGDGFLSRDDRQMGHRRWQHGGGDKAGEDENKSGDQQ
jgi:Ca2+-binding EF-hand superfamily protein